MSKRTGDKPIDREAVDDVEPTTPEGARKDDALTGESAESKELRLAEAETPEELRLAEAETPEELRLAEAETPEELLALWEAEGPAPSGGLANLVACLVTGALGLAGMVLSWNLGLGSLVDPGPGFFPFAVALIATFLSAAQILLGRRGGDGEKFTSYSTMVIWGVLSLAIFVAVLPLIGFEIPSLLLSFVWMKFLGSETWRSATIYSLLVVAAFYAVFVAALRTQIPHLF